MGDYTYANSLAQIMDIGCVVQVGPRGRRRELLVTL